MFLANENRMDIISVITTSLLGVIFASVIVLLLLIIIFNLSAGAEYREPLARRVQNLRLNKMLCALGIDTYKYLHKENAETIKQHVERCTECVNTTECDEEISNGNVDITNIDYCNNEESLKKILERK